MPYIYKFTPRKYPKKETDLVARLEIKLPKKLMKDPDGRAIAKLVKTAIDKLPAQQLSKDVNKTELADLTLLSSAVYGALPSLMNETQMKDLKDDTLKVTIYRDGRSRSGRTPGKPRTPRQMVFTEEVQAYLTWLKETGHNFSDVGEQLFTEHMRKNNVYQRHLKEQQAKDKASASKTA